MNAAMERIEQHASFGGRQEVWQHDSVTLGCAMRLAVYLPPADVDWDQLIPTDSVTLCPYKGAASYWRLAGERGGDVAWSYQEPLTLASEMAGHVCFYDNVVDVEEL